MADSPPPVTRWQIFLRGLSNRCPNCGDCGLFRSRFRLHRRCPVCALELERGEGFFLGSMSINYGITILVCLVPLLILGLSGVLSPGWAVGLAVAAAMLFPIVFYRSSRSWWLMAFFCVLPHELPANRRALDPDEDENV